MAKNSIIFVTGNHENYIGLNRALNVLGLTQINILQNKAIDIDGLDIIGISYPGVKGIDEIQDPAKLS